MKVNHNKTFVSLLICLFFLMFSASVYAQKPSPSTSPSKEAAPTIQKDVLDDPLGRSTPQGTVIGFMKSVDKEDYERAIEYLDTKQPQNGRSSLQNSCRLFLTGDLQAISPNLAIRQMVILRTASSRTENGSGQ